MHQTSVQEFFCGVVVLACGKGESTDSTDFEKITQIFS